MTIETSGRYADRAINSEFLPPLPDSKKRTRVGDELQPWCDYATINPYEKIASDVTEVQSCEADDKEFYKDEWWGWTHQRLCFVNNKLGLKALILLIPYIWGVVLLFGGMFSAGWALTSFSNYWDLSPLVATALVAASMAACLVVSILILPSTTNWIMSNGIGFLLSPFKNHLQQKVDKSLSDGMSEFNRVTGQAKFALGKGRYFEAPFIEFDAYVERVVQRGGIFYRLIFVHRYTGKVFNKTWLSGVEASKHEVLALWDMLQRFMDVSQPIPDMPRFEPFRHLDPVTAEYDRRTNRPPRYWRDLDLEAWKSGEGAKMAMAQARFPWGRRVCKLTPKLGQIDMATYREQRPASASVI